MVAIKAGTTSARLFWDDRSDNETGFRIYRKTGLFSLPVFVTAVGANVESAIVTGLQPGTTYTFEVRAVNLGGESVGARKTVTTVSN